MTTNKFFTLLKTELESINHFYNADESGIDLNARVGKACLFRTKAPQDYIRFFIKKRFIRQPTNLKNPKAVKKQKMLRKFPASNT